MISIEPFYFGPDNELFGIYHPPIHRQRSHAVLVAGPLLNEAMRAHYALRQISLKLAALGYHVMRFDYAAMGDSHGDICSLTPPHWEKNFSDALLELKEISGARVMSVAAVRYSACIAAKATTVHSVDRLLMWDPIFSGECWFQRLRVVHRKTKTKFAGRGRIHESEFSGHVLDQIFIAELRKSMAAEIGSNTHLAFVTSSDSRDGNHSLPNLQLQSVPFDCGWESLSSQVLFPHAVITALCDSMK